MIARSAPALPLVGGGHTRFQPVFAGDVASAVVAAVEGRTTGGCIYELGGPDVRSLRELMEFVLRARQILALISANLGVDGLGGA